MTDKTPSSQEPDNVFDEVIQAVEKIKARYITGAEEISLSSKETPDKKLHEEHLQRLTGETPLPNPINGCICPGGNWAGKGNHHRISCPRFEETPTVKECKSESKSQCKSRDAKKCTCKIETEWGDFHGTASIPNCPVHGDGAKKEVYEVPKKAWYEETLYTGGKLVSRKKVLRPIPEEERYPKDYAPQDFLDAEWLARKFHETYEGLAPYHGYETRKESATKWEDVPPKNKNLMIGTVQEIIPLIKDWHITQVREKLGEIRKELRDPRNTVITGGSPVTPIILVDKIFLRALERLDRGE